PMRAAPQPPFGPARERAGASLERLELAAQIARDGIGVSGADLPGEDQIASPVAVTHEQRADAVLAALGIGEAADDELLPPDALRLHPVGVSSRPVARVA